MNPNPSKCPGNKWSNTKMKPEVSTWISPKNKSTYDCRKFNPNSKSNAILSANKGIRCPYSAETAVRLYNHTCL